MAGYALPLNNATYPLIFHLLSATDGQSPVTGATPTVTLSKDGAAYAAPAGAVTEIGNGDYKVAANATDANTLGPLVLNATATGAVPASVTFLVVAYNPFDAVALGLSRIDAAVSTRATPAQILTTPSQTLATDGSGRVTVATNADKTGYALTAGEHTSIATDAQTGLTAQGYTTVRAGYIDTLNGLIAALLATVISATQAVVTGSVGEALAAARALAFGKKVRSDASNTVVLYHQDQTTVLETMTQTPSNAAPTTSTPSR